MREKAKKDQRSKETYEWPVPKNYFLGPQVPISLPGPDPQSKRPRETMKKSSMRWAGQAVQVAFLEDRVSSIFAENVEEARPIELMGVSEAEEFKNKFLLQFHRLKKHEVESDKIILSLDQVYQTPILNFKVLSFKVTIADFKPYYFAEQDFNFLSLSDIDFIYQSLSTKITQTFEEHLAR